MTGGKGMLGRTLRGEFREHEVVVAGLPEADITDAAGIDAVCRSCKPDVLIHCAAMTDVDKCETCPDMAWKINAVGSANVASACQRNGIRLIAISTDYVFSGDSERPYTEFDTPTGGINVYGQSKWAGEQAVRTHCPNHIIVRISWLYGPGGPSFVHTMLKLADGSRNVLKVVNDQHGNPTSTFAVVRALRELLIRPELVGTFHLTCEGEATWYDFARRIFELAGKSQKVVPCSSAEYVTPARRPANSRLEKKMLALYNLPPMPHWEREFEEFMVKNENIQLC
ncbi:MAG: dTDP-4-dehydrorhamnose reductase [Bilophila wadsworthia]